MVIWQRPIYASAAAVTLVAVLLFVYSPSFFCSPSCPVFGSASPRGALLTLLFIHTSVFDMISTEKSNCLAFGVTSFPSSTPHQDSNQSGPNHHIGFTFRPPLTYGGLSQWASDSAGLLDTSPSGCHAPDVSENTNSTTSACKMALDPNEKCPSYRCRRSAWGLGSCGTRNTRAGQ